MERRIKAVRRLHEGTGCSVRRFGPEHAGKVQAFHQSFPEYRETPLRSLGGLARELGVSGIYVKDESLRFGLNAFKVLGGSYCIGSYIADRLGMGQDALSYEALVSGSVRKKLGELTFATATDGNHGRGIAWTAQRLGQKSVVYMPKGSAPERLERIRALGANAAVTDMNYDDTVRYVKDMSDQNGWIMAQDTAWEGYEKIPGWIMEGYTTMAYEAWRQLEGKKPTHLFLQAGVGAMAGAVAGFFADLFPGQERPVITIVEPDRADCFYRTALADDGALHAVTGDLDTIMAGLACGEPCTIAWEILRDYADFFVSMPDEVAAKGMRVLGHPVEGDERIISGESGAAAVGFVAEALLNPELEPLKRELGLGADSRILCISTEGDTDQENYRRIVWDGWYPSAACGVKTM